MNQPTKKELRDRVNELVTELSIARSNEMQTKERLETVSNELVREHKKNQDLEDTIFKLQDSLRLSEGPENVG